MEVFVLEKWSGIVRLLDVSDAYRVHICDNCGLFGTANLEKQLYECLVCTGDGSKKTECRPSNSSIRVEVADPGSNVHRSTSDADKRLSRNFDKLVFEVLLNEIVIFILNSGDNEMSRSSEEQSVRLGRPTSQSPLVELSH